MINIQVFNGEYVRIENDHFLLGEGAKQELLDLIKFILDKVYYGGEVICLESVIESNTAKDDVYEEIGRWSKSFCKECMKKIEEK